MCFIKSMKDCGAPTKGEVIAIDGERVRNRGEVLHLGKMLAENERKRVQKISRGSDRCV